MSRKTISRNLGEIFGIAALLAFATPTVFADNISKTFEFGPGTQVSRSNVRTFNIPCGTPDGVAATIKFKRYVRHFTPGCPVNKEQD